MKTAKVISRRVALKLCGAALFVAGLPSAAWGFFLKRFPVRTVEKKDFRFDPAGGSVVGRGGAKEPYALVVDGLVDAPLKLSYAQVNALPQVEQVSDFHCVEGWSVADLKWGGFRVGELLDRAGLKPGASHVVFHALGKTGNLGGLDHYTESYPIAELTDPKKEILLVLRLNGEPLPQEHGAPLRLISPYDLAYKSIKFVTRLEVTDRPRPGWWTEANPIYPVDAPVPSERLRKRMGAG